MRTKHLCVLLILFLFCGCAGRDMPSAASRRPALIEVPQTRQSTPYTCGAAAVQSILAYNGFSIREDVLAGKMGSTPERGTDPHSMMACMREYGIVANIEENMTMSRLRAHIGAGRPVICFLQAWNDDPGFDYAAGWEDGHYAIAIGYDATSVYFMDPSTLGNYTYIPNDQLLKRWHDGDEEHQVYQAGIVVTNPGPSYRRDAFLPML